MSIKKKEEMKKEIFDFSEALRRMKDGNKVRRVIWEECGAYIHIVSETIVAVCDGEFFPCVFKDSEDILATDWEEVKGLTIMKYVVVTFIGLTKKTFTE